MTLIDGSLTRGIVTSAGASSRRMPTLAIRWIVISAFCIIAAVAAMYVWFSVFQIRFERPADALFGRADSASLSTEPGQPLNGWAAWYIPALAAAFVASVFFNRLICPPRRWSAVVFTIAGCCAVLVGVWIAQWVEHNGFMWHHRTDMTLRYLLSLQSKLAVVSFGEALVLLKQHWAAVAIGGVAGTGLAIAVNAPIRSIPSEPTVIMVDAPPSPSREQTARVVSTIALLLFSQIGSQSGNPLSKLAVGLCVCLIWYVIAFPRVRFDIKRLLLGSFVSAVAAALIHTIIVIKKKDDFATAVHMQSLTTIMIVYITGFVIIFFVTAKITVALYRKNTSQQAA